MTGTRNMKKGFTLIELIIAVGLFSILVAIAAGGYVNALRTEREVAALASAQSNAGLAIEQMTREVRTGYLFCHDPNNNNPSAACNCTTSGTTWTCSALDFYNSQTEHVNYSLAGNMLTRSDNNENGGVPEIITSDNVAVSSLRFILQGQLEGDHWNPSSTDPAIASTTLHLETSVSARQIDCGAGGC